MGASDPFLDRLAARTSLRRPGRPEELAGALHLSRVRRFVLCHRPCPGRGRRLDRHLISSALDDELDRAPRCHPRHRGGIIGVIDEVVARLSSCFQHGGKLLICGNGGSAADAQHLAAEFMNRMRVDHEPWPAIALTTDTSVLTSIANDADYDDVFARQVEALGRRR